MDQEIYASEWTVSFIQLGSVNMITISTKALATCSPITELGVPSSE